MLIVFMKKFEEVNEFKERLLYSPLSEGKNLIELSSYQDITLWWFEDFTFHFFLMDNLMSHDKLKHSKFHEKIISRIIFLFRKNFDFIFKYLLKILTLFIIKLYGQPILDKKKKGQKEIILLTGQDMEWRPIFNVFSGKTKKDDQFFSSLINLIEKKYKTNYYLMSTYNFAFPFYKSVSILIDKRKNWIVPYIPSEVYYNSNSFREKWKAHKNFQEIWVKIENDKIFKSIFDNVETQTAERIRDKLKYYYTSIFPKYIGILNTADTLIENISPSIILFECEYCGFQRALLIAAHKKKIPTLAIQHGNMGKFNPAQNHSEREIAKDGNINSPYYQIPDVTAVYGEYFKNILIRDGNYPNKSVVVTGQPRYDILFEFQKIYTRKQFCIEHSLDPDKPIILIMTENLPIFSENLSYLKAILLSVKDIPNIQIVIKPHPGERSNWYEKITKKIGLKTTILPKSYFSWCAMVACDVMVAYYSTTITEAIILNKPIICVNVTGKPNPIPYHDTGCVLEVVRQHEISLAIEKVLYEEDTRKMLENNREKFITDFCYNYDGKSSDRVIELIHSMVKRRVK